MKLRYVNNKQNHKHRPSYYLGVSTGTGIKTLDTDTIECTFSLNSVSYLNFTD